MPNAKRVIEVKLKYLLDRIEHLEGEIQRFRTNIEGHDEAYCKEQIDILGQILSEYQTKIHAIEVALAGLDH